MIGYLSFLASHVRKWMKHDIGKYLISLMFHKLWLKLTFDLPLLPKKQIKLQIWQEQGQNLNDD